MEIGSPKSFVLLLVLFCLLGIYHLIAMNGRSLRGEPLFPVFHSTYGDDHTFPPSYRGGTHKHVDEDGDREHKCDICGG